MSVTGLTKHTCMLSICEKKKIVRWPEMARHIFLKGKDVLHPKRGSKIFKTVLLKSNTFWSHSWFMVTFSALSNTQTVPLLLQDSETALLSIGELENFITIIFLIIIYFYGNRICFRSQWAT